MEVDRKKVEDSFINRLIPFLGKVVVDLSTVRFKSVKSKNIHIRKIKNI